MKKISLLFCLIPLFLAGCGKSEKHQFQGYVEGDNLYLASPYAGTLQKLFVNDGEHVQKGQTLFKLDEQPQLLKLKQSEADLLEAKKTLTDLKKPSRSPEIAAIEAQISQVDTQLKLAKLRAQRRQKLYTKNAIDKESLDEAIAEYQSQQKLKDQYQSNLDLAKLGSRELQIMAQEAKVVSLEAKLDEAKWELEQKTVSAPTDGILFDNLYDEGEYVGREQPVVALLPYNEIYIEFFVPVEVLNRIKLGQTIDLICYGCQTTSQAVISFISPEAQYVPPLVYSRENDDKLVFRINADLKQPKLFKPGQPVTVTIP